MSVLVDTNVLLRRAQPGHPSHADAVESVASLVASGQDVFYAPQNIAEFWNVATRPATNNGLGFSVAITEREVDIIERTLTLLPDSPAAYAVWKDIVAKHQVLGSKVHDARLVASMLVHGVGSILTFNGGDFTRFGIGILHPAAVAAAARPAPHLPMP
jgi:predicted nucleic acid-binding protein